MIFRYIHLIVNHIKQRIGLLQTSINQLLIIDSKNQFL